MPSHNVYMDKKEKALAFKKQFSASGLTKLLQQENKIFSPKKNAQMFTWPSFLVLNFYFNFVADCSL